VAVVRCVANDVCQHSGPLEAPCELLFALAAPLLYGHRARLLPGSAGADCALPCNLAGKATCLPLLRHHTFMMQLALPDILCYVCCAALFPCCNLPTAWRLLIAAGTRIVSGSVSETGSAMQNASVRGTSRQMRRHVIQTMKRSHGSGGRCDTSE
jgi:hypothetical protein